MKSKLFLPLILCALAACNDEAEYSGRVETRQDMADCLKAATNAGINYEEREGRQKSVEAQAFEDRLLASYEADGYLSITDINISSINMNPELAERNARWALNEYANGAYTQGVWTQTCLLAYVTGEKVDWPDY